MSEAFYEDCLNRSNFHRKNHGAKPLTINKELSSLAQTWAKNLMKKGSMMHNDNAKYKGAKLGENIAFSYTSAGSPSGASMVDQWYNEIKDYDFNKPAFSPSVGHFTQLVWKDSRECGFGLAVTKKGEHFLVAYYYPLGNYNGKYAENVLPFNSSNNNPSPSRVSSGRYDGDDESSSFSNNNSSCSVYDWGDAKRSLGFGGNYSKNSYNSDIFKKYHSNDENDDILGGHNTSTTTTIEEKIENGCKTIITTTITKTPRGREIKTHTTKEYL